MPNPENVIGKGNKFSSTNQPKNRGRKPKLYTLAAKGYNIEYTEFRDVLLYVMQLNQKQLKELTTDEDTPVWVVNIARAIYKESSKGVWNSIKDVLDRTFGNMKQMPLTEKEQEEKVRAEELPTDTLQEIATIIQKSKKGDSK